MKIIRKILNDELIPVIMIFAVILSLIIASKMYLSGSDKTKVLGIEDPGCHPGACGYCTGCGGELLNCGKVSRCVEKNDVYSCRFDVSCL